MGQWQAVTESEPGALTDVLVTTFDADDGEAMVWMAWRGSNGQWLLSGADEHLMRLPYAWMPVPAAAPVPVVLERL